jgi:hypothetical protein
MPLDEPLLLLAQRLCHDLAGWRLTEECVPIRGPAWPRPHTSAATPKQQLPRWRPTPEPPWPVQPPPPPARPHLLDLRRHHRQHLGFDAVELVEAAPGAALHQAAEDRAHGLVVQPLAAVEHDALDRHALGQVLDRLGLAWILARGEGDGGCGVRVCVVVVGGGSRAVRGARSCAASRS